MKDGREGENVETECKEGRKEMRVGREGKSRDD